MLFRINVFYFIFITYINHIISVSPQKIKSSPIEILTDKTFEIKTKKGKYNPWLLLFTLPKCALCNQTLDAFSNFTRYYYNENNDLQHLNLSFGKLDCFQSSWTAMRFNLISMPQIIMIENNSYYLIKNNVAEESIEEFIKAPGESKIIPPPFTYFVIFSKVFNLLNQYLEKTITKKGIKWNISYTIILIIFAFALFCVFEYYFINHCCRRKKKPPVHIHTN